MTSFIAAGGSGRSASVIPAVPAASSVTTIAFIRDLPVWRSHYREQWPDVVVGDHAPAEFVADAAGRATSAYRSTHARRQHDGTMDIGKIGIWTSYRPFG